jgi:class 3 adenylate cyclase/tetratricopeptide (TPR) repeat protein
VAGTRRLAAIMFTDMVGYSALAQRDEPLALRLLETHRGLLRAVFREHAGREVKTIGDAFLVEFTSALQAAECAVAIQRKLVEYNEGAGPGRIDLRIGIHLGDVIDQAGDLLGDAVNIASRIEPLAETSGVCISGPVFDQVRNKIPYGCTQLEHAFLKNIDTPIFVYSVDLPWVVPPAARITPWTDRESELRTLERIVEDTAAGRGQIVALSGEPGVGKTRLADEGIRRAEGRRFRTLRGRGHQDEQPVPYSLWVQVVRGFLREAPAPLLYKVGAGCGPELVRLAPEVGDRLGQAPAAPTGDPGADQLRFFEGVAQFFLNVSHEAPLLILLDDVQWADPGSLRLLNYLAEPIRTQPILLLLTYRDSPEDESSLLRTVIQGLTRAHVLTPVPVRRMEGDPARRLVGAILGTKDPPTELVGMVGLKTGGNPLFVEELLRSMTEERQLVRHGERWEARAGPNVAIPATLRDVILKRVARAGERSQQVLSVAAVLGGEFDFDLLREVSGVEPESLLRELESLLRARLLREWEVAPGRSTFRFADDQTREVLYHELSLVRRQQYHLKTARALEARGSGAARDLAGELALHYHRGNDLPKALEWTVTAGTNSARVYAREQAVSYFQTALQILNAAPNDQTRARVLEQLGDEQEILGQYAEAARSRTEASGLHEQLGDRRRAGSLLQLAATHSRWTALGEFEVNEATLVKARGLLESVPPSPELARLYLDYAAYLRAAGRFDESRPLLDRALQLAKSVGNPTLEASVHLDVALTLPMGSREDVKREIDRALELGLESSPPIALMAYLRRAHFAATGYADMGEAEEWIQKGAEYARKVNAADMEVALVGSLGAFTTMWAADVDESARRAERHQQFLRDHGQPQTVHNLLHLAWAPAMRGEFEEARKQMELAAAILSKEQAWYQDTWFHWASGEIERLRGDPARAEELCRRSLDADRQRGATEFDGFRPIWFLSTLVDVAVQQNAFDRADAYLAELELIVRQVGGSPARAYLVRATGQLALARGDPSEAIRLLRESADLWRGVGWKLDLARTLVQLSTAEGAAGDPERRASALDQAITLFRAAGARLELERALVLRASPGANP